MWTDNMYTYTLDYNPDCVLTHHGTAVSTRTDGSSSALLRKKHEFPSFVAGALGVRPCCQRPEVKAAVICFDRSSFIIQRLLKSHFWYCSCAATTLRGPARVFYFFSHLLLADCLFEDNHLLFPWLMTCVSDVNSYKRALPAPRGVLPRS